MLSGAGTRIVHTNNTQTFSEWQRVVRQSLGRTAYTMFVVAPKQNIRHGMWLGPLKEVLEHISSIQGAWASNDQPKIKCLEQSG
jgi:hypothetical protein